LPRQSKPRWPGGAERAEIDVEQRPAIRLVIEEPDPARQLHAYAATQPGVWSRVGPLLRVLDSAAVGDPELAEIQRRHADQRLNGLRRFAQLLADRGALRADLTPERAAHLIATVCAQADYDSLVTNLGWTHAEYCDWLARALIASLLP